MELVQNAEAVWRGWEKRQGELVHTGELYIRNVKPNRTAWAERICEDLCWLLSLAGLCRVVPISYTYGSQSREFPVHAPLSHYRPVLELGDGRSIRQFVEEVWPRYRTLKRSRRLPQVFHYLIESDRVEQPVDGDWRRAF